MAAAPRSARRAFALWVTAALLVVPGVPAAHAGPADVLQAGQAVQRATERRHAVQTALDEAAELFERANAHSVRLSDESAGLVGQAARARDGVVTAEEELVARIARAYKHPGGDPLVVEAVLMAPDTATALHRAAVLTRMVHRGADRVDEAERVSEFATDDLRQQQIVSAGTEQALRDLRTRADQLNAELADARRDLIAAEASYDSAKRRAAAEAAAEAERQRRAAAAQVVLADLTQGPPPAVAGKVCPVGRPNGFIDSWGYPRSGGRGHQGVDMFAPYGTPLYAVADGTIYRVYTNPLGGLAINLIDVDGNMYYYAHLSSAAVSGGETVKAGDVIGAVGDSGNARGTPPHLHWQFHPGNGAPINPYPLAAALCR